MGQVGANDSEQDQNLKNLGVFECLICQKLNEAYIMQRFLLIVAYYNFVVCLTGANLRAISFISVLVFKGENPTYNFCLHLRDFCL